MLFLVEARLKTTVQNYGFSTIVKGEKCGKKG